MTKTLTLTAALAACYLFGNAQIKKDAVLLGGQVSLYQSKQEDVNTVSGNKINGANFNITAGKAIKENTIIGVYGNYGQSKMENTFSVSTSNKSVNTITGAGVFVRKYKGLGKGFYFFGEINAGYEGNRQEYENNNGITVNTSTTKENGAKLGLTPGLSYQLFKKLQLEVLMQSFAGLRYGKSKTNASTGDVSKGDYFQLNSSLNSSLLSGTAIGFRLVL